MTVLMPNKHGGYQRVKIPAYMDRVLFDRRWGKTKIRIREIGHYWYKIEGWQSNRPAYGIEKDIELLKMWLDRYAKFCDGTSLETITDVVFHKERKNYWVKFKMVDPFAMELERAGLVILKDGTVLGDEAV